MAVPFLVPEIDPATSAASTTSSSTTASTTATMPQPQDPTGSNHTVPNKELLVQAFCEALMRYTRAGGSMTTPPSPSSYTANGHFSFNEYHGSGSNEFYGIPRRLRSQSLCIPQKSNWKDGHFLRTSSQATMTDDEDDEVCFDMNDMEGDCNYMVALEQFKKFPGRVPHRKRKANDSENPQEDKNKPKESNVTAIALSSIIALGVLAVGCGYLAAR